MSDLIDRQAAIDALGEQGLITAMVIIDHLPPAQPGRKKGKWIDREGGIATCSECGDRWGVYSVMNYCPTCGAYMK